MGIYPLQKDYSLGFTGSVESDRFFTDHYWSLWFGKSFGRQLKLAASLDIAAYSYSPGDAKLDNPDDPVASSPQTIVRPSFSAGAAYSLGYDLSFAMEIDNILRPNMAMGNDYSYRWPTKIRSGVAWRFSDFIPFADFDIELGNKSDFIFSGGAIGSFVNRKLTAIVAGGNDALLAGVGYKFGAVEVGYGIEKPLGEANNVSGLTHSAFIEFEQVQWRTGKPEPLDSVDYTCQPDPMPAKWLIIRKYLDNPSYKLDLSCSDFDSVNFYYSSRRREIMSRTDDPDVWRIELPEFPGPNSWITGYLGERGFCLENIYNDGASASRMTIIMDEYVLFVPFGRADAEEKDTIAAYSSRKIPFYLDSDFPDEWDVYVGNPGADRFLFASPTYMPEPPEIELASEFAVEKVDNRIHAVVTVSAGHLPHRIIATSDWAGSCVINTNNPLDTLSFIVPDDIPDTIPIIVSGSATDPWMRIHRIGPDTLDNLVIAKVWENTDFTLFNFIYFAENERHCSGDIDSELERLISRTAETGGKLLITGNRYQDALCAYDYARRALPATQVRIDPSLIPSDVEFDERLAAPDSLWFINNFSQAIVEWEPIPLPDDVAGYVVFADDRPIPQAANFSDIKQFQLNSEPVVGNMFIITDIKPEICYYIRIAAITGDGKLGELSKQLLICTKTRRKTVVYEFKSKLGNPSAFDFSEYTEVSMQYKYAQLIDLYVGTDAPGDEHGNLMLKSPSMVTSPRTVWQTRTAGIIFMDLANLNSPFDVQELTTMQKKPSEPCRVGGRYLVRTPDGYELVIRVESVEGEYPDRRVNIQYLYRLVEDAPIYDWNEVR